MVIVVETAMITPNNPRQELSKMAVQFSMSVASTLHANAPAQPPRPCSYLAARENHDGPRSAAADGSAHFAVANAGSAWRSERLARSHQAVASRSVQAGTATPDSAASRAATSGHRSAGGFARHRSTTAARSTGRFAGSSAGASYRWAAIIFRAD